MKHPPDPRFDGGAPTATNEANAQHESSMKPLPSLLVPFVLILVYGFSN